MTLAVQPETLVLIAAGTGLIGAIGGALAAGAAWRAALVAKRAATYSEEVERRALKRAVVVAVTECVQRTHLTTDLGRVLIAEHHTLDTLCQGRAVPQELKDHMAAYLKYEEEMKPRWDELESKLKSTAFVHNATDAELLEDLLTFERELIAAKRLDVILAEALTSVRREIDYLRGARQAH